MLNYNRILYTSLTLLILVFVSAGNVSGEEGYKIIDTQELNKRMKSSNKPVLAFTLSPIEFSIEHIPGSRCVPFELIRNYYDLPEDPNTMIVFYCHGPG